MKRAMICAAVLVGVFSLGYWTARSPLVIREEMPSATEVAELRAPWWLVQRAKKHRSLEMRRGSLSFLQKAVDKAEAEYRKTGTAESKASLILFKDRLKEAQAAMAMPSPR